MANLEDTVTDYSTEVGIESPNCIQVVMAPAEQHWYRLWLSARDLHLYEIPGLDPDDLPTYAIGIGADTRAALRLLATEPENDIEATGRCCCAGCVGMGSCDRDDRGQP